MDDATEDKVRRERDEAEIFRRPLPKSVTRPTTVEAAVTTQPATQPIDDTQLEAGINTMLGVIVFESQPSHSMASTAEPTTQPATQPAM